MDGRLLGEHVCPWLINNLVLAFRYSEVPRPPLGWLSPLVTRILVWIAAPAILAFAWWRSMPAHDEWLTLAIALCLLFSLRVVMTSWLEARQKLQGDQRDLVRPAEVPALLVGGRSRRRGQLAAHRGRPDAPLLSPGSSEDPCGDRPLRRRPSAGRRPTGATATPRSVASARAGANAASRRPTPAARCGTSKRG